jgi:hypothetical protein
MLQYEKKAANAQQYSDRLMCTILLRQGGRMIGMVVLYSATAFLCSAGTSLSVVIADRW